MFSKFNWKADKKKPDKLFPIFNIKTHFPRTMIYYSIKINSTTLLNVKTNAILFSIYKTIK